MAGINAFGNPPTDPGSLASGSPTEVLLRDIVNWLSGSFELPAIYDYPRIAFASPARLTAIRYHGLLPQRALGTGSGAQEAAAENRPDIAAVYDDATKTIFLADSWTGATPADISVLVHEMVHHLQNLGKLQYDCPAAREKPAYRAQDQWLKRSGQDLETVFGVDMLTVLVRSACYF